MNVPHAVWRTGEKSNSDCNGYTESYEVSGAEKDTATLLIDQEQRAPFLPLIKKGNQEKATSKNSFLLLKKEPTSKLHIEKNMYKKLISLSAHLLCFTTMSVNTAAHSGKEEKLKNNF